jgi:uncharacterized protein
MKEERVTFKSGALTLEGLVAAPQGAGPSRAGVICHPHPLYGGSMHNNVVDAAVDALRQRGFASLRFNFRGVGASEGEFDNGNGEAHDAAAAVRFMIARQGMRSESAVLAGYSFGSVAAVRAAADLPEVTAILALALPLAMVDRSALAAIAKPIVLLAGDRDSYCPAKDLAAMAEQLGPLARLRIIAGADHFFAGREQEITAALAAELATL